MTLRCQKHHLAYSVSCEVRRVCVPVVVCDVNWSAVRSGFANGVVSAVNRSFVILRQDSACLNISALADRLRSHVARIV